jgi:hypothetical protein
MAALHRLSRNEEMLPILDLNDLVDPNFVLIASVEPDYGVVSWHADKRGYLASAHLFLHTIAGFEFAAINEDVKSSLARWFRHLRIPP